MNHDSDDYSRGRYGARRGRQIEFDDDEFGGSTQPDTYGRRDSDWADDLATRSGGPLPREYDDDRAAAPRRQPAQRTPQRRPDYYDEEPEMPMNTKQSFRRRHPVLVHLLCAIGAAFLLLWMMMWFLDYWTFHGQERVVPDVKGQSCQTAIGNVDLSGLKAVVADSVFDNYARPGTVTEQTPVPGARIKNGGTVYLTIVAFSPKLVTVPEFYNVSVRQARSMFEGIGIKDIREVPVVSDYKGLVLGAMFNGVTLQPGARIPLSAVVTLQVGSGFDDTLDTGADVDTLAIDNAIDELNIE